MCCRRWCWCWFCYSALSMYVHQLCHDRSIFLLEPSNKYRLLVLALATAAYTTFNMAVTTSLSVTTSTIAQSASTPSRLKCHQHQMIHLKLNYDMRSWGVWQTVLMLLWLLLPLLFLLGLLQLILSVQFYHFRCCRPYHFSHQHCWCLILTVTPATAASCCNLDLCNYYAHYVLSPLRNKLLRASKLLLPQLLECNSRLSVQNSLASLTCKKRMLLSMSLML